MNNESPEAARVLVVDDDTMVANTVESILLRAGYRVEKVNLAAHALARLDQVSVDVVVSDVAMPGMTGLEMLEQLRKTRADLPVVFMTGVPKLEDTMRAMELGAFRYIAKPFESDVLLRTVEEAVKWAQLTNARTASSSGEDRAVLKQALARAMEGLQIFYQPIVGASSRRVFGYEALMRSFEPMLRSPPAVLEAAEKLGRLHALGRQIRDMVAAQASKQPFEHTFFVNLHSADLADPHLYDPTVPLSQHAKSVVLELTERASLEGIDDVERRLESLRAMGYRIAVDDLGAGYAGLSYFARVNPDIVKIDMSLTRNVDSDPVKRRVVSSMCGLARDLSMIIVAEGIETEAEMACVTSFGADLVQGYVIGKPAPYPS